MNVVSTFLLHLKILFCDGFVPTQAARSSWRALEEQHVSDTRRPDVFHNWHKKTCYVENRRHGKDKRKIPTRQIFSF